MSKSFFNMSAAAAAVLCTSLSSTALAYEGGDIIVRSGVVGVYPNESSTVIDITAPDLGTAANSKVGLNSEKQLGLTAEYILSNKFGIELLAATPFSHDILGAGTLEGVGKLGKTKHLPPTLSVHYYLNDPLSNFQPYVGMGLNYTTFFDTSASSTLNAASTIDTLATLAGAAPGTINSATNTDIELEDSVGLALQIGFDLGLTENLSFKMSYWKVDIDTEAKITTNTDIGQVTAKVDVDIDPNVVMFGLAYKF